MAPIYVQSLLSVFGKRPLSRQGQLIPPQEKIIVVRHSINESDENAIRVHEENARMLAKWKREIQDGKIPEDPNWK